MFIEFIQNLSPQDWGNIFDAVVVVGTILFPGAAIYLAGAQKGKNELLKLVDKSRVHNTEFIGLAKNEGLKEAVRLIERVEEKKNRSL